MAKLEAGDNYQFVPLDLATLKAANDIQAELEMHDRLIVATAQLFSAPILTKDKQITDSGLISVVW